MTPGKKYRIPITYRHLVSIFLAYFFVSFLWTSYERETTGEVTEIYEGIQEIGDPTPSWTRVPSFKIDGTPEGYGELYLFSAYFDTDDENNKIVKIIATAPNTPDTNVTCHFYGENGNFLYRGNGVVRRLANKVKYPYSGGFVLCSLKELEASRAQVLSVSVSNRTEGNAASISLKISRTPTDSKPKNEFAICVQPVFNYDKVFDFIQWLEFHKMMGVTHFTFYNVTMGPKVSCALHALLDTNSLSLINGWGSIPMIHNRSLIFTHAQLTQITECNLRYRGRAKYYLNVDLDEYIVPNFTLAKNYSQLMSIIGAGENETLPISQYIFRNSFFFPNEIQRSYNQPLSSSFPENEDLLIYSRIERKEAMEEYGVRSKFIADPWGVIQPGVHRYITLVPGYSAYNVPVDMAYLHHYRNKLAIDNTTHVVDTNGRKVTDELLRRIRQSLKIVESNCSI